MKKIYGIIFAIAALAALVPLALAEGEDTTPQKGPDYYLNTDGSIGYMKSISRPNTNGVYTITLESFATGSSTKLQKSIPADIVLVLDVSGSMSRNMSGGQSTSSSNPSRLTVMKEAVRAFIDQIDINDQYEKYVAPNSPENVTRKDVNGNPTRLGNRIAIVTYSTTATTVRGLTTLSGSGKQDLVNSVNSLTANGSTYANLGMTNAYNILQPLGDDRQLLTTVMFTDGDPGYAADPMWENYSLNNLSQNGRYTWNTANSTINVANNIKNLADSDKGIISSVYTVSIQTNLSNYSKVYLGKTSSNYTGATRMAQRAEFTAQNNSVTWNSTDIWANGNGTPLPADKQKYSFATTEREKLIEVFETIAGESGGASEDLGETTISEVDVVSSSFTLPENVDKSSIKVFIAECTGRETKSYIDEQGNTKTESFLVFGTREETTILTNGTADPNNLSGFTYDKHVKNTDGTETITETPVDANITIDLKADSSNPNKLNIIEVNGYDYGGNWCGPKLAEDKVTILGWHGHKIIIEIPILMDEAAVGGADVKTNEEGSGIFVKGVNVAPFKSPQVSLPINLHIRKEGLEEGESAKFTIQRRLTTATSWTDVSSVFVTRHKGQAKTGKMAPTVKVRGMPSVDEDDKEFVYRIVEDDWNWSYELTQIKDTSGTSIGSVETRSATSDMLVTNPFIFVNSKKTDIEKSVRHAESKATNTFKTGLTKNVEYDDSKKNTGTGREDEED